MAAFGTDTKQFTSLFNAALQARKDAGIVNALNKPGIVPGGAAAGAITTRITTAVTLQSPADGTMLANNAARTEVNLTAFLGAHTASLFPYEVAQWDADTEAKEINAFLDAAILAAETEVVTDLVGGTAGTTATLTAGQLNFSTDGTDAEIRDNLGKLHTTLSGLMSKVQGKPSGIFGVTTATGYGNIWQLMDSAPGGGNLRFADNILTFRGFPIYIFNQTVSGYGAAAGADAFYWVHPDAEALVWSGAEVHSPMHPADDGLYKKIWQAYGFAGLIQSTHYATIANGTS